MSKISLTTRLASLFAIGAMIALGGSSASAQSLVLPTTATQLLALDGTTAATNDGTTNTGVDGAFAVRERRSGTQTDRRIQAFFTYDISGVDTSDPSLTASVSLDLSHELNQLNPTTLAIGVFDTSIPVAYLDFPITAPSVLLTAVDELGTLGLPVTGASPTPVTKTADITSLVAGAGGTNLGLFVYVNELEAQSAGFTSPVVTVTTGAVVPEPSSLALLGLGVVGLVARRRRK